MADCFVFAPAFDDPDALLPLDSMMTYGEPVGPSRMFHASIPPVREHFHQTSSRNTGRDVTTPCARISPTTADIRGPETSET